jgi:hypothetical protein
MRLYFHGSRDQLRDIPRSGTFPEVAIQGRMGVLLTSERPVPVPEAVIPVDIPDGELAAYARGPGWAGDYIVPRAVVERHNPDATVSEEP